MKKLVFLSVFLFSMLNGNEIAWKQNISNGMQYHVKCNNGEERDIFYYYDSKRYFVGGVGNYATLDSAKQHACKSNTSIVTVKKGALVDNSLQHMKKLLSWNALWNLGHYPCKTCSEFTINDSIKVELVNIYKLKGKKVPKSSHKYIDDIVEIFDGKKTYYVRKNEVIF